MRSKLCCDEKIAYRQINVKQIAGRYIDRGATLFSPCTKDYIFAPMDDDRPCFVEIFAK